MKYIVVRFAALILTSCWLAGVARAADESADRTSPDKSGYNLLNRTPADAMRELSPDRPDKTECPYTVDAGHFQLEMDFANYTADDTDGVHTKAWNAAPFNLKVGLLNNVDWQLVYDNYLHVRTKDRLGQTTTQSGFSDFTTRLKINLWGNDGGRTAFGLLPFVKFPTSTDHLGNNSVEGGVILPLAVKLPGDWDMGLEVAGGEMRNEESPGHHAEFVQSITFDHHIIGKLSGYCEFFSDISTTGGPGWIATVDVGLEYLVTENVQLDCGGNLGLTPAADDVNVFSGITVRY
jgi:hypothetical protein